MANPKHLSLELQEPYTRSGIAYLAPKKITGSDKLEVWLKKSPDPEGGRLCPPFLPSAGTEARPPQ